MKIWNLRIETAVSLFNMERNAIRNIAIPLLLMAIVFGCCNNKPTGNNGITVGIDPHRMLLDLGTSFQFTSYVNGTDNKAVYWSIEGGADNGVIDTAGNYTAPEILPVNIDSVRITARSQEDSTKSGGAWAVLVDPSKIFVSSLGSDTSGLGTRWSPYRTITKALYRAQSTQIIIVGAGQYDLSAGERFPLHITSGIAVQGAGSDSTFVISPGGMDPQRDAAFELVGYVIVLEKLCIRSLNSLGVGVWMRQGSMVSLSQCLINQNYIGVYISGLLLPRPIIETNSFIDDSIGIVTVDSSGPIIRNNLITGCSKYGIEIRDFSRPNLGVDDTTGAGNNRIQNCGDGCHWLVYNATPDTILAIGNHWPNPIPQYNDVCIYDDEETNGFSGPVILINR